MPLPTIATAPCAAVETLVIVRVWPGSGSMSFDRTVMVLVPLSSRTVTVSSPVRGRQSIRIETVASLLLVVPSVAVYLNEALPQAPAFGVNVNAPLGARSTVPAIGDPGDNTALRPSRA